MVMDAASDAAERANRWNTATSENDGFSSSAAGDRTALGMTEQKKRAQDWITIWQSELSALAADPEVVESWHTLASLWADTMATMLRGMPDVTRHDDPSGRAAAADATRPAPVDAAPDARDAEITRLQRQVDELERRLAALEPGGDLPVHGKSRGGRKPRK